MTNLFEKLTNLREGNTWRKEGRRTVYLNGTPLSSAFFLVSLHRHISAIMKKSLQLEDNSENGNLRHCESFNFVHPMSLNAFGSNFAQA